MIDASQNMSEHEGGIINMKSLALIAVCAAVIGLIVAVSMAMWIKKSPEGNDRMKEISGFIREGAFAFLEYISRKEVYTAFLSAIGFTPTQDVTLDNAFLNSLADGLQAPCINAEMYIYAPKGVGEYGSNQFSFFYLQTLGGELTGEELAQRADEDFELARQQAEALQ